MTGGVLQLCFGELSGLHVHRDADVIGLPRSCRSIWAQIVPICPWASSEQNKKIVHEFD
jgi:hypothetical protein